jgi:hypothetical protein
MEKLKLIYDICNAYIVRSIDYAIIWFFAKVLRNEHAQELLAEADKIINDR